jgi:hypothetical protein
MHTSRELSSTDFQYGCLEESTLRQAGFAAFCPDYQVRDRVGIVSPYLEDGILHTGYALLALTTAFYDRLRAQSDTFFDYPHHFAFLDATAAGVALHDQRLALPLEALGSPWGGLDVWPDSNWILTAGDVTGMLKKVFDWQISRLFWPNGFVSARTADQLPVHVWRLLRTRLQTVYYYNTPHPTHEIRATQIVETIVQRSIARLPQESHRTVLARQLANATGNPADVYPYTERYQHVSVDAFQTDMAFCFPEDVEDEARAAQVAALSRITVSS